MTTFVAAVALSCCLAGCGGAPKPKALPADPPSPSPTASTPTPPVMPAAAKANTKAGAEAFVRHYVDALNYAGATGDVSVIHRLAQRGCQSCAGTEKSLSSIYGAGGHIAGGAWLVTGINAIKPRDLAIFTVDVQVRYGRQRIYDSANHLSKAYPAGSNLVSFQLSNASGWRVREATIS